MIVLSAIGLTVALAVCGGYLGYGATGALTVTGMICATLFAVWINRTA
jgi:hypothetical protein